MHDRVKKFTVDVMKVASTLLLALASAQMTLGLPDPNQGPGGPILVITTSTSPIGKYYAEILRTEGFNEFAVADISTVTPTVLSAYDVAILAPQTLSAGAVTMLNNWVTAGGNLIAMQPDPQLLTLLGLNSAGATLSNAYFLINGSTLAGNGITSQPLQFHGSANLYTLNGAASLAMLYSSFTAATANPAATLINVGTNGGHAAAFAFDVATSVVQTRQGNPAWAAQERDGFPPIRSDDKYFGAASGDVKPDWVDLSNEVSVPQADELQRLLANLILEMNLLKRPLPRFWYFPRRLKAVVIMTGDDHANGGTAGRFDQFIAASPSGCSVANWECVRGTSNIYTEPQNLTNAQAVNYTAQGFEISLHINTDCADFTASTLDTYYSSQLSAFTSTYTGIPSPLTQRHHCIAWSDWLTAAKTELKYGMRLDTTYYFWPASWVLDRPGHFTGSAMPMRFADLDGSMIDVYGAVSQMTDESGQSYPATSEGLLSAAVGPQGYYGAYTVNAHTDEAQSDVANGVLASAQSRGIPLVTQLQMLNWLDARNSSSFNGVVLNANVLNFTITPASGANGIQAMLPTHVPGIGVLGSIRGPGNVAVTPVIDTIKGIEYAFFPAAAGSYTASYTQDTTAPTITAQSPSPNATGVAQFTTVTGTFSEAMDPTTITTGNFVLRDVGNNVVPAKVAYSASTRTAILTPNSPLSGSANYVATMLTGVKDLSGNSLASSSSWSFTTETPAQCPCSGWSSSATPANPSVSDPNPVEVGVKFRLDLNGSITGIRFYKGTNNTGTHIGNLWTLGGQLLATATFVNETATGWQQVIFANPVAVTANTVYVASYHTNGNYAGDNGFFGSSGVDNVPVHLLKDGVSGGNGVYVYGASAFPTNSYQSTNYWVDVVFTTSSGGPAPLSVVSTSPTSGATTVSTTTTVSAVFNNSLNSSTIRSSTFLVTDPNNTQISGTYATSGTTATFTPASPLNASTTYKATLTTGIQDVNGSSLAANQSWSFTTAGGGNTLCGSPPNAIVAENCLTGNPSSEWDISGAGDSTIQGFATEISVNQGGTINFKVSTPAAAYRLDIYRMGYYNGSGARKIATLNVTGPQNQPSCLTDPTTGLIDCGNWTVSVSWNVPANATSGIYFARAVRTDTGGASHIFFIVRNDASHSNILFQTSDTTWQAYNDYGGNNLYTGSPGTNPNRAYKVSYNRPYHTRVYEPETWVFNAEYPMVRWLEANGYDVTYTTDVDSVRNPLLTNHKVWMSNGHDEYWSAEMRASVQAARDAGIHLAFFSGNTIFWKARWEPSIDGSNTLNRTLVCYKETHANAVIDPKDPTTWTGTWRDPRFSPPADGGKPENALVGTLFRMNGPTTATITVPQADGLMRFWRNTSVATLGSGQVASLAPGTIGAEVDDDEDNGFRPAGLFELTSTPISSSSNILLDYGSTYGAGSITHKVTLYKAPSRALVFAAGTYQWAWGLDSNHDRSSLGSTTNVAMQQATVNLFADMGVQPDNLQTGLQPATASTDASAPTSTITSPTSTTPITAGAQVTISGTATDAGGGVVAGIEVSTDGGTTWHPAIGRTTWSYAWTPAAAGSATLKNRAVDDSGNIETPGTGVTVTVGAGSVCSTNCTIWSSSAVPIAADAGPDSSVELGVQFKSDTSGVITGIRFYKASTNTGTHTGTLWSAGGQLLATATFSGEGASGWQQVSFASPVAITANTVYVASYHCPNGHYSEDDNYFANKGVDNIPLHALQNGAGGTNGVFIYSSAATFPTQNFNAANYWVDVVFSAGSAPTLTSISVTPANPTIAAGATQQFTATGTYSDNSTKNITTSVTWTSSSTAVATINSSGLATGVAGGNTTIKAASGGVSGSTTLTVKLSITTTSLPAGSVGTAYSASLAARGGTTPYTWTIASGLPPGLTLNSSTGAITGTPTTNGTFTFTAQVKDSAVPAATASKSLSIGVTKNTGFLSPSSNAQVTASAGDNNGFELNPTNAYTADTLFAVDANSGTNTSTSCTNTGKDKHDFFTYNIVVPTGATVKGIEVNLSAKADSSTGAPKMCVQLSWNGGTTWSSALNTTTLTTANAGYVLGAATNIWGHTWAAGDTANTAFRVRVIDVASNTLRTFSLDRVAVRVTYQ